MEAVPRLPMLSFELRQPDDAVDFGRKLKQYIRNHYNENPELFNEDIRQLEGLRSSAVYPTRDIGGCLTMKRYFCQLHFLSGRFPMKKDGAAAVRFSWKLFNNNGTSSSADISFEMTAILYNIGALHSQLGAEDSRTTAEGMKMACTHFQCAAWAFQHLCEKFASTCGTDLSADFLYLCNKISLGQAQECILEKSMLDNRKASIIAKVTVQTIEYYKQALKMLVDDMDEFIITDTVGSRLFRKWEKFLKFKINYLWSIAFLFQGQQSEEQQKMGERVAFYQSSYDKLEEARRVARSMDNAEVVNDAITFLHDIVEAKRKAAKNENEFIYHEEVPEINMLPHVRGASLVKGIPFNINDQELSGPDIFARLVPMRAHESSSLYSEEKAKLLRKVVGMIEGKDEELETFLSTLQLDDLDKSNWNHLPQELVDKCAAINGQPNVVKNLSENMAELTETYMEVEKMLLEIMEKLDEEERREMMYQASVGKRPPTIVATDLTREAHRYREAHCKGSDSNKTLNKAMLVHLPYLKLLASPLKNLINELPEVEESPEAEAVANEMRHLVDKVNEMKKQRIMLKDKLREALCQDDILNKLVNCSSEKLQALFEAELKKHQPTVSLIEQNLAAQENIVKAVKDAYARYGSTRRDTSAKLRKRSGMISSLMAAADAHEDLLNMTTKGLDFYKKLHTNVSKLLQRVKGTCMVQNEEREEIIKNVNNFRNNPEPAPTEGLKLKDYLNLKKELGRLSLDDLPVGATSQNYHASNQAQAQGAGAVGGGVVPTARPMPLGSEQSNGNAVDSYPAVYQGKDQTWTNAQYPVNDEDQAKYYAPQNAAAAVAAPADARYPNENHAQSMPQDIYPISAYSSVMPNVSTTGYAGPKSNYYNTENSPSRYINPPHFYPDQNQPTVSGYCAGASAAQQPLEGAYAQPKPSEEKVSPQPASYPAVVYPYVAQPSTSGYAQGAYVAAQPDGTSGTFPNTSLAGPYQIPGTSNDSNPMQDPAAYNAYGIDAFTLAQQAFVQYTNDCGNGKTSKISTYGIGVRYGDLKPLPPDYVPLHYRISHTFPNQSIPGAYDLAGAQAVPNYFMRPSVSNAEMAGNYAAAADVTVSQNGYSYPTNNLPPQQNVVYSTTWQQPCNPNPNLPISFAINPSLPVQSGNESLYTACQMNNYSVTNSGVYKTFDGQNNIHYANQYYVNQYGSSNGQNQYGACYGNAATYMQAGADGQQATTTTTYSSNDSKPSPATEHSNVDLLGGLDFNVGQSPLIPEIPAQVNNAGADANNEKKAQDGAVANPENKPADGAVANPENKPADGAVANPENKPADGAVANSENKPADGAVANPENKPADVTDANPEKKPADGAVANSENKSSDGAKEPAPGTSNPNVKNEQRQEPPAPKEPYIDVEKFRQDVEKYEKFVESLTLKTLNGPTCLDIKWKEITDVQDKSNHLHIISVARCYPMKNRFPDILPYDDSRVELPSTKDDYINASLVKDLSSNCPNIILTQAPLPTTYADFWAMVVEQKVEVIVCLLNNAELDDHVYFPKEKGQEQSFGKLRVSLQSSNVKPNWVERIMSVSIGEWRARRVIVHIQFTSWPGRSVPSFPESPDSFLAFANECINFFSQQRRKSHPIVVHCTSGVGRSGLFCLIVTAIQDIQAGRGIPDLVAVTGQMSQYRKNPLRDREHLKFAYQAVLSFCQDFLAKLPEPSAAEAGASGSRRDSSANSCSSSGRTSPSSLSAEMLSNLDPAHFNKADNRGKKKAKKRYSTESFKAAKNSEINLEGFNSESDDPLNRLDPLWTMKK